MIAQFIRSAGRYLGWFLCSIWPGAHPGAPIHFLRLVFLLFLFPAIVAVQLFHWAGFLIDEVLFGHYRAVQIKAPIFISGIPRSGTTFVHRTIAENSRGFTYFKTWEAILAPSITERKCLRLAARIDAALGGYLLKLIQTTLSKFTGELDDIHEVKLASPEEDYLALLPVGGCFLLVFAFPFSSYLRSLGKLDKMPMARREQLLKDYHRCLQKHLYYSDPDKRLLTKNAAFSTWLPFLQKKYPDASFIVCVRDPERALSSQLSSLEGARRAFGTDPDGEHTSALMLDTFEHSYRSLKDFLQEAQALGGNSIVILEQTDLRINAGTLIANAAEHLGFGASCDLRYLRSLNPSKPSSHKHQISNFPIDSERMKVCIDPCYQEILAAKQRISN